MATEYKVIAEDLDPEEATDALARVHASYTKAVETDQPIVMLDWRDLAYVLVLAALWVEDNR